MAPKIKNLLFSKINIIFFDFRSLAVIKQKLKQSTSGTSLNKAGRNSKEHNNENSLNRSVISQAESITDETSPNSIKKQNINNHLGQSSYNSCNVANSSSHSIEHLVNDSKCSELLDTGSRKNKKTRRSDTAPAGVSSNNNNVPLHESSILEEGIFSVGQRLSVPIKGSHTLALRRKSALYGKL